MSKPLLIATISKTAGVTAKVANDVYNAILESLITETVDTGRSSVNGLGVFHLKIAEAHKGRNPLTNTEIQVPTRAQIRFSLSPAIRSEITERIIARREQEKKAAEKKKSARKPQKKAVAKQTSSKPARKKAVSKTA